MSQDPYSSPSSAPPIPSSQSATGAMGDDAGLRLLLPVGRSGWAIAAGYLGLFSLAVIPAPLAIIVSIIAIRQIRKSRLSAHPKHGMGRAVFGLVMGIVFTLVLVAMAGSALIIKKRVDLQPPAARGAP